MMSVSALLTLLCLVLIVGGMGGGIARRGVTVARETGIVKV